jgi:exonuclease III
MDVRMLAQIVGGQFTDFVTVNVTNTARRILLTWQAKCFKLVASSTSSHSATVDLVLNLDNTNVRVTGVYGPAAGSNRTLFLDELIHAKSSHGTPWMLCGDFNLTLSADDRSNPRGQSQVTS